MSKIKSVDMLLIEIKYNFKNIKKNNKEIELLKNYISKSNIFVGKRKSLYRKINKYKLK